MERRGTLALLPGILKGTVATLLLVVAYTTLPLVGTVAAFFLPFPAALYGLNNRISAAAIVALAAAGTGVLLGWGGAPLYLVLVGIVSLSIPEGIRRGWSAGRTVLSAAGASAGGAALGTGIYWSVTGVSPDAAVATAVRGTIKAVQELYRTMGVKGEDLQAMEQALRLLEDLIVTLYPALGVIFVVLAATATVAALRRRAKALWPIEKFQAFRTPEHFIWIVIVGGFAAVVPEESVQRLGVNVLAAALSLYFVQGFAILTFFFEKYRIAPVLRTIVIILLVVQPYLLIATLLVGLFDMWGGFRTAKPKNL